MTIFTAEDITINKLDAARRQLQTAIRLWFSDGDPVSIHTLAYASYEIVHAVSKRRDPNRRDLLFDTDLIKDEYRSDFAKRLKEPANFFKHANKDGDEVITFNPSLSEGFILYAILGLYLCGERSSHEEQAFQLWISIHDPRLLTEEGREWFANKVPAEKCAG